MRKRERFFYIVLISAIIVTFVLSIVPPGHVPFDTKEEEKDSPLPVFTISPYDSLFQHYADTLGLDWKMLAAIAYVESRFDTMATSHVGAKGLMQLMPRTAKAMGIPQGQERDPEMSIQGATKLLLRLNKKYRRVPEKERINFILAAYNGGAGHINDAMRLTTKYGGNRYVWKGNVEKYLRLKSDSIYYTDSLCRNGRFMAVETTSFVRKVQRKYSEYDRMETAFDEALLAAIRTDSLTQQ